MATSSRRQNPETKKESGRTFFLCFKGHFGGARQVRTPPEYPRCSKLATQTFWSRVQLLESKSLEGLLYPRLGNMGLIS